MDNDEFFEFIDFFMEENVNRLPKRYIRDTEDPFRFYSELEFKKRYRFSKSTIQQRILPLIEETLKTPDNRGLPINPVMQLLIALRFYATGNFQVSYCLNMKLKIFNITIISDCYWRFDKCIPINSINYS